MCYTDPFFQIMTDTYLINPCLTASSTPNLSCINSKPNAYLVHVLRTQPVACREEPILVLVTAATSAKVRQAVGNELDVEPLGGCSS